MDPDELFKRFFGFEDFDQRRPGHRNGRPRDGHHSFESEGDMFGDWHQQMHQQMEDMERQMMDVFRIFRIPDMHSVPDMHALPGPSGSDGKPRDHMLKDADANGGNTDVSVPEPKQPEEPSVFTSPNHRGVFSKWFESFPKLPHWDRVHPEDMRDTDLDGKNPSSAEIADMLSKKKDESPKQPTGQKSIFPGFSFQGSSVRVQTIVGKDGTVEERRTVRDSSGREETTVTRKIGDSSHTVTTIRDGQGQEEKRETFNNIDKDKMVDFDRHWKDDGNNTDSSKLPLKVPTPRDGVLSDDTNSIFRKFFGF